MYRGAFFCAVGSVPLLALIGLGIGRYFATSICFFLGSLLIARSWTINVFPYGVNVQYVLVSFRLRFLSLSRIRPSARS